MSDPALCWDSFDAPLPTQGADLLVLLFSRSAMLFFLSPDEAKSGETRQHMKTFATSIAICDMFVYGHIQRTLFALLYNCF